jgi:hypothetical protein
LEWHVCVLVGKGRRIGGLQVVLESRFLNWRSCGSEELIVGLRSKERRASERVVIFILTSSVGFAKRLE